jgi:prepilin-type N-terminal cleavage/methylation domain-containing protein
MRGILNLLRNRRVAEAGNYTRDQGGFTLLEVMAALAVLALTFVVLLETDAQNATRTLHSDRVFGALQVASEKMEEVFASGSGDLFSDEGVQEDGIYSWERIISDTEFTGLKEVRLVVTWNEGEREESYAVLAYLPE